MVLNVYRSPEQQRSIAWRPALRRVETVDYQSYVRREIIGDFPDKTIGRYETDITDILDPVNDERWPDQVEARIEDPYNRGKLLGGFVFDKALWAFVHENSYDHITSAPRDFGPGIIFGKDVRIDDDVRVGSFTELESGVRLKNGAQVGDRALLRKGVIVLPNATLEAAVRIGQFVTIPEDSVVGAMSIIGKQSGLDYGVSVGRQCNIGAHSHVRAGATIEDSVRIGAHGFVGRNVIIGEMTTAGSRLHIGDGAILGAESVLGSFVRVAKGVWLRSPTYAETGAFINKNPSEQYVGSYTNSELIRTQYDRYLATQRR